jgi:hypothetical protein
VKRRRRGVQLTERQQLILALFLVILVAISLLYCVGLGSLVLRQVWRDTTVPWNGTNPTEENMDIEMTPTLLPAQSPLPTPAAP